MKSFYAVVLALSVTAATIFPTPGFAQDAVMSKPIPVTAPLSTTSNQQMNDARKQEQDKAACAKNGEEWGNVVNRCLSKSEAADEEKQRAECKRRGGQWGNFSMLPHEECLIPYADGNKPCQKNSECSSNTCLVDSTTKDHGRCLTMPYRGDVGLPFFDNATK